MPNSRETIVKNPNHPNNSNSYVNTAWATSLRALAVVAVIITKGAILVTAPLPQKA